MFTSILRLTSKQGLEAFGHIQELLLAQPKSDQPGSPDPPNNASLPAPQVEEGGVAARGRKTCTKSEATLFILYTQVKLTQKQESSSEPSGVER